MKGPPSTPGHLFGIETWSLVTINIVYIDGSMSLSSLCALLLKRSVICQKSSKICHPPNGQPKPSRNSLPQYGFFQRAQRCSHDWIPVVQHQAEERNLVKYHPEDVGPHPTSDELDEQIRYGHSLYRVDSEFLDDVHRQLSQNQRQR